MKYVLAVVLFVLTCGTASAYNSHHSNHHATPHYSNHYVNHYSHYNNHYRTHPYPYYYYNPTNSSRPYVTYIPPTRYVPTPVPTPQDYYNPYCR